jgi:leucyl aminopeptidase
MKVTAEKGEVDTISCDVLIVGMHENDENSTAKKIDNLVNHELSDAIKRKEFTGEYGQVKSITTLGKTAAHHIIVVGLGKKEKYTHEQCRRASSVAVKAARMRGAHKVVTTLHHHDTKEKATLHDRIIAVAEGTLLGNYRFTTFKTENKDKEKEIKEFVLLADEKKEADKAISKARIISAAVTHTRDLVNMPPNIATPDYLAKEAQKLKKLAVKVKVYGKKELIKMGFNTLLAVAQGSVMEPKFVVMEYGKGKEKIALVGKGITFDSGGLDLKSAKYMEDMKMDMGGAATVLAIMEATAQLKLPVHLICAFPTCENMPSATSYRPGDVITSYNKKNIELMNTDAEGRMILSDALAYMEKQYKPSVMIDFATLTGAVISALGYWATGMLSTDDKLCTELTAAGNETYDRVWRLPLWDEYKDNLKSDVADVRNIGKGYDSGVIEGAWFLKHFVDKVPWVHLDIAGTAWRNDSLHYFSKGGTGAGVRLILKWLETRKK